MKVEFDRQRIYMDTGNIATTGITAIADDVFEALQEKYKYSGIAVSISVSLTVILSLLPVVTGISYGYKATFIIYCLSYFLETVFLSVIGAKKALPKYLSEHSDAVRTTAFFECLGSSFSVKLHYLFCIVLSSALMFIFA